MGRNRDRGAITLPTEERGPLLRRKWDREIYSPSSGRVGAVSQVGGAGTSGDVDSVSTINSVFSSGVYGGIDRGSCKGSGPVVTVCEQLTLRLLLGLCTADRGKWAIAGRSATDSTGSTPGRSTTVFSPTDYHARQRAQRRLDSPIP